MIRCRCPKCAKMLAVKDEFAGKVGTCPACKSKFRIPEIPVEVESVGIPNEIADPNHDEDEPPPRVRKRSRVDEEEDPPPTDDDDEEWRPRRKKKRRRRKQSSSLVAGMEPINLAFIGGGVLGLLLAALAFVGSPFYLLASAAGLLTMLGAVIWFLILVARDNVGMAVGCFFCNIIALYVLITNFAELKRPFFVWLAGFALLLVASFAAGLHEPPDLAPRQNIQFQQPVIPKARQ